MTVKGRTLAIMFLAAAAAAGGWWYLRGRGVEAEAVAVSRGSLSRTVEEDGYVEAVGDRWIQATQTARVEDVAVETGDAVEIGQLLIRLANADIEAQLEEARTLWREASQSRAAAGEASRSVALLLEDARRTLSRYESLRSAGALSLSEYEQARLRVDRLERELAQARSNAAAASELEQGYKRRLVELRKKAAELEVTSPMDGFVLKLPAEEDQVVAPGELLVSLAPEGRLEVRSEILSDSLTNVEVGQSVRITAPVLGKRVLEGEVRAIYPLAEEVLSPLGIEQRRVPVYITLPERANLMPGYEVRVAVETARREEVLLLPVESVRTNQDSLREVLKVTGGRIEITPVETGISDRRNVEIVSGLDEGDLVVRDAGQDLEDGTRVRIR
jgi:HlyD family secretion protein